MPRSCSASSTARGNEPVHHVVEDLIAEPLLDDRRRHLARPEAGDRDLLVALRDAIDLGVDDGAVDLDRDGLLGLADVGEFGLHRAFGELGLRRRRNLRRRERAARRCHPSACDACAQPKFAQAPGERRSAKGGTRTPIPFRVPDPKSGASASSATFASISYHVNGSKREGAGATVQALAASFQGCLHHSRHGQRLPSRSR